MPTSRCVFQVHFLDTNGLNATSDWTEGFDRRQNECGSRRGDWTFLYQHRALADRGPQGYQERNGGRGLPRESHQRRLGARAILCVVGGATEPGCEVV